METIIVYTYGAARSNPGPASVGVYMTDAKNVLVREVKKVIGNANDDFAAYYALMLAMDTLRELYGDVVKTKHIEFRTENELVKKQLNNERPVKEPGLVPMFIEIHNNRVTDFLNITVAHILQPENKEARRLAAEAMEVV
jgi:ribonuclease HI